ncbi:MAG TPA: GNAT family N-acetyltransferase [Pyrinomonadaceae bacterium]|jgi:predicted GNAT superfamily acetyltransferase|nr:GNAT family N-acetyltransferase [Pyrinomonadaceae bacterium]
MEETTIRECTTIEEFDDCVALQREAFGLPDLEISPRRHLIVSRQAGGWTLGAFVADHMVGFVHHLAAVRGDNEIFGYSHMMAVAKDYQNKGVGVRLKWAQRERAMREGRKLIKWTWDPMMARNAHFNLNRLGATVETYADNFYGVDYNADASLTEKVGLPSDRLIATWNLGSERVNALAKGTAAPVEGKPLTTVAIPAEWQALVKQDPKRARDEQARVRDEFQKAFQQQLVCAGFERGEKESRYLLFERS